MIVEVADQQRFQGYEDNSQITLWDSSLAVSYMGFPHTFYDIKYLYFNQSLELIFRISATEFILFTSTISWITVPVRIYPIVTHKYLSFP